MKTQEKKGANILGLVIISLAAFFILSSNIHNHAFSLGIPSADTASQSKSAYPNHSNDFCSACRIQGNINRKTWIDNLGYPPFGVLIALLNHDLLIPPSFLASKKSPRSPPII